MTEPVKTTSVLKSQIEFKIQQSGKPKAKQMIQKIKRYKYLSAFIVLVLFSISAGSVYFEKSYFISIAGCVFGLGFFFLYSIFAYYISVAVPVYKKRYEKSV